MSGKYLEAGQIVNTHGIHGEVKIVPWCDSPEFLCQFDSFYIDEVPTRVERIRIQKGNAIVKLEGIDDADRAVELKDKVIFIDRDQADLPEGRHFLADLFGLEVRDAESDIVYGTLEDIFTLPSNDVFVVHGEKDYMIPAVDEFIKEINVDKGFVRVHMIEGMES